MQIEIPFGCELVRSLLAAIEHGLRIRQPAPLISYDRTCYIPCRPVDGARRTGVKSQRLESKVRDNIFERTREGGLINLVVELWN